MSKIQERRRVLVIDDNEAIHTDFRKTLEQQSSTEKLAAAAAMLFGGNQNKPSTSLGFDVESALQGKEGYEKVAQAVREGRPYAIAFVDMRMPPGWDGVETIQHLWEIDPELQVVICTAFSDYSWEQIISKLGTTDRLLILKKPFDPMEVCQLATALTEKWKLKRQASMKHDELERAVHERTAELRQLALMDRLTGLPNRACLSDLLNKTVARTTSDPAFKFAVLFLDFDRFKLINDSLGHEAGDSLLIEIANRLRHMLNQCPGEKGLEGKYVAARLGGDEFVVVQQEIEGLWDATVLAEKLLAGLGTTYDLNGQELHSTASLGIATSEMGYQWGNDILRDADSAMYQAKLAGKARYAVFTPEMHQNAVVRLNLENDLRRALERKEFQLWYQPVVSLVDATLVGFEALLRWKHSERGIIAPADFIPMAEETGLILPIGQWVIEEAARQLQDWTDRLPDAAKLTMALNCSRKQLIDPKLIQTISSALSSTKLAPERLHLEITESVMMEHGTKLDIFNELKTLGIRLHMDDFGTGYSSLTYLHSFPLDVLKIDRSFVLNVSLRRDYAAVINAIVVLAHNLGAKVIAEGIETADHAAMLCALDCDLGQGYFFAKPMSAADAEAYIVARDVAKVPQLV